MNNRERVILTLFGEGEGVGNTCAAEQVASESNVAVENGNAFSEKADGAVDSRFGEICELLGIGSHDEATAVNMLKERRARAQLLEKLKARKAERAYADLISEASDLLSGEDGFELSRELSDKRFCAMIRSGLSMREAWRAIHAEELIEKARTEAQSNALMLAIDEIRSQAARPSENGAGGNAPASSTIGVENLSGRGIRDILRRVEKGAKIKF